MATVLLNRSILRLKRAHSINDLQADFLTIESIPRIPSPFSHRPRLQADDLLEQPDFELDGLGLDNADARADSVSNTKFRKQY